MKRILLIVLLLTLLYPQATDAQKQRQIVCCSSLNSTIVHVSSLLPTNSWLFTIRRKQVMSLSVSTTTPHPTLSVCTLGTGLPSTT